MVNLAWKKKFNFVFSKESKLVSIYQYNVPHRVPEIIEDFTVSWIFLVAQMAKNLPPVQKTWVRSLGREDPLEEGMASHSSIPGESPWTEEPSRL